MKLLKIYSDTCGPCKVLEKNLQLANIEHESFNIASEQGEEIVDKYDIRAVPTLILLNDNNEVIKKHTGVMNIEDLRNFIVLS